MLKEITPRHLRCEFGYCSAVYAMDDGNLVVVGKKPSSDVVSQIQERVGDDEYAVVISPDFFRDLPFSKTSGA